MITTREQKVKRKYESKRKGLKGSKNEKRDAYEVQKVVSLTVEDRITEIIDADSPGVLL